MYMEPIVRAQLRQARPTNPVDLVIGLAMLTGAALLLLPSIAFYGVYIAAALIARAFWKNPRAGR